MSDEKTPPSEGQGKSPLMLALMIVVPFLVVVVGAVAFLLFTPTGKHLVGGGTEEAETKSHEEEKKVHKEEAHYAYYDLPDILVNILNPHSKHAIFLKLSVYLEIKDEKEKPNLDKIKPKILDQFQVYLRGLRIEDLQGSSGIQKLRADLLKRAQEATGEIEIHDVLFKEMLIQ